MAVNNNIILLATVLVLLFCIATLSQFGLFLSSHSALRDHHLSLFDSNDKVLSHLLKDACLLLLFVLQHSLQKQKKVKECMSRFGLAAVERLFYNFGSCLALQILMAYWQSVNSWTIWEVHTADKDYIWWSFTCIHSIAWLIIYSGCFIMDITELLGIKQVHHSLQNWPEPLGLKSEGLQRFYSHMRHPCFSTLTVILLVHPVMQIDRLLLACGLLIYMLLYLNVDDVDYEYQRRMLKRKERDLRLDN